MEKHFDINEDSRSIRCRMIISNKDKQTRTFPHVVIVTHGFGSNKETTGTTKFGEHITAKYKGFAVLAFDWPCHGNDARKKLTITECLAYLQIVTNYARNTLDAKDLYIYASSFGGYITLHYLLESGNPFRKIALRCPAIRMHDTLESAIPDADKAKLKKGKDILVGFTRKMKIDQLFLKDMAAFKVEDHEYFDFAEDILILHGTKDEVVPFAQSKAFAEDNLINFIPVENANHPFQNNDHMAFAIHQIVEFFKPEDQ